MGGHLSAGPAGIELRRHQREALTALDEAWGAGRDRAWVVLPPGAGKTLVGLETARRMLTAGDIDRAVVLGPNTAIQAQWVEQATGLGLETAAGRDLDTTVSVLTYQSLAVFDADDEVTDDGEEDTLLSRLHENGRALVAALREAGPILLVLDECHHLLEVWGRLLAEVLAELPRAHVLGLTATPPAALTSDQGALVDSLFGGTVYEASIPAVVREGDLAPFAELAWLTTPTEVEAAWLREEAVRFHELVHQLTDPGFGSLPFLEWLDRRFVSAVGDGVTWASLVKQQPALCAAALRMHHAGLIALPTGARLLEEHRHDPTSDDWVVLLDDWLTRHLSISEDEGDAAVVEAVRRALPSVGYLWTRRGIRRGRSPVDRVLARSEAKTRATVEIVGHEHLALGDRLRMLVLCDHERASAMLPARLDGVLDQQEGSAHAVLAALLDDPVSAALGPLLVTGRTVAGAPQTLRALVDRVALSEPFLATQLTVVEDEGVPRLEGPWTSRTWVGHVTRFFEEGGTRVLVGTRGLLGEGWDARRVTGLVDLTSVTTTTAVVQTRGRALRIDPAWPEKVAVSWSVVCVTEDHPNGDNDWQRLVRKHAGFFGVDDDGDVVDGVAHVDPLFSPFAPPAVSDFDACNARMVVRSQDRPTVRERWRVGAPYADHVARTVRLVPRRPALFGALESPAPVVVRPGGLEVRGGRRPWRWAGAVPWWLTAAGAGAAGVLAGSGTLALSGLAVATVALISAVLVQLRALVRFGREALVEAARPPAVSQVASAVADSLASVGLTSRGSDHVRVEIDHEGEYRCLLSGVPEEESDLFATALDEAVSPIVTPRYVLPRHVVESGGWSVYDCLGAAFGRTRGDTVAWHAVPT
ncbi:DEAD/DEAH box helicase family protein, partial [Nocardioides sp.]|uniref:DEAD/DEAH box helicase family protein n=1 Tax=Nocardioides sp. TaxID=35761 RepID=UPI002733E1D4